MTRAPGVTELQAGLLRLVRDNGGACEYKSMTKLERHLARSCLYHRWLAPRTHHVVLTDGGKAALSHFDASCAQEALWKGARG